MCCRLTLFVVSSKVFIPFLSSYTLLYFYTYSNRSRKSCKAFCSRAETVSPVVRRGGICWYWSLRYAVNLEKRRERMLSFTISYHTNIKVGEVYFECPGHSVHINVMPGHSWSCNTRLDSNPPQLLRWAKRQNLKCLGFDYKNRAWNLPCRECRYNFPIQNSHYFNNLSLLKQRFSFLLSDAFVSFTATFVIYGRPV